MKKRNKTKKPIIIKNFKNIKEEEDRINVDGTILIDNGSIIPHNVEGLGRYPKLIIDLYFYNIDILIIKSYTR